MRSGRAPFTEHYRCTVQGAEGERTTFELPVGRSLLHSMVARGVELISIGCRGGGCGVCRVRILDGPYRTGMMSRRHVTEVEEQLGFALACRIVPLGDVVLRTARRVAPLGSGVPRAR